MSPHTSRRWFVIGAATLVFAGASFFIILTMLVPLLSQIRDQHRHATPTRAASVSTVLPLPTPTASPTPVPPHPLQISSDPYTNSTSQHQTEVEPASFAYG